jgi:hypothetical protein
MPIDYVSDYEELTGRKPDGSPIEMGFASKAAEAPVIETKVIEAPEAPEVAPATVAEVQ